MEPLFYSLSRPDPGGIALISPLRLAVVCFFMTVLQAQDPVAIQLMKYLKETQTGALVLLYGPKEEGKGEGERLLRDPGWIDLGMSLQTFESKAVEVEKALKSQCPDIQRPGWALFGFKGRLLGSGSMAPKCEDLAKVAQEAGLRTPVQVLKEFLRANPDQLEARAELIQQLSWRAGRKTQLKMKLVVEPTRSGDKQVELEDWEQEREKRALEAEREAREAKAPKELTPEEDVLIWAEVADQYHRLFQSGDWERMQAWNLKPSPLAKHSPSMKEIFRRSLPDLEAGLRRCPTSWDKWSLWLAFTDALGGRPIRQLLDSLTPSPLLHSTQWPPDQVKTRFIKDAKARQDWQSLKELLLPDWENRRLWESQSKTKYALVEDGKIKTNPRVISDWRETLEPLVEALLRLGEGHLADQVVRYTWSQTQWESLPEKARIVALRCQQASYAAAWSGLGKGQ